MDEWPLALLLDEESSPPPVPIEGLNYEVQVSDDEYFTNPRSYVTSLLTLRVQPVVSLEPLWVRVRVFGSYGSPAPWSLVQTIVPGNDPFSPEIPTDLVATPGFEMVGLTWPRAIIADLGHYDVRWTTDLGGIVPLGPDPDNWTTASTLSSSFIVHDLDPLYLWWFQVRAVDTTGNTRVSDIDNRTVPAVTNPEAGWGEAVPAYPSYVGTEDIAYGAITSDKIATGAITADMIDTGTLTVGRAGESAIVEVRDAGGNLLARWDEDGILMLDPQSTDKASWMAAGEVRTTNMLQGPADNLLRAVGDPFDPDDTTWTNSLTADGINATAITFGISPGGHNNLPNSGFELTQFTQLTNKVWTSAADWGGAIAASSINVTLTGTELTLTTATY